MRDEKTTAPMPETEQADMTMPAPDLSVLAEQPPAAAEPDKQQESKAASQELTETTPAPVGLVVALVVMAIIAAVVVTMWMVSPLMALLLGAGLIVLALLVGVGWWAWRRFTRRAKTGKDGSGRGDRGGNWASGGRGRSTGRGTAGGRGKGTAGGGGKAPAGARSTGTAPKKPAGSLWPFGRGKSTGSGKTPGGGTKTTAGGSGKTPAGGKPTGDSTKKPTGKTDSLWPFGRGKSPGGSKAPSSDSKPAGDSAKKPGDKALGGGERVAKTAGAAVLLGLVGLFRAAKRAKTSDGTSANGKPAGKGTHKGTRVRPTPGGPRPETVIDVDIDDITSAPGRTPSSPGGSSGSPAGSAPRPAPRRHAPLDPGSAAGSGWQDRNASTPLRTTAYQHPAGAVPTNPLGGPEMTTTTNSGEQDALRVANRYAALIEKATTLRTRAQACLDAAAQYRSDARANQESADNHRMSARTIRDPNVAHQHAVAARDAEAEAAREILAARYYEQQSEQYQAQASAISV